MIFLQGGPKFEVTPLFVERINSVSNVLKVVQSVNIYRIKIYFSLLPKTIERKG